MPSEIQKVKFKQGLPQEIEVVLIAETILKNKPGIASPHRAEFYHIFWIQQGTAEYYIDFELVTINADSFLFINKDRVQAKDNKSQHDGRLLLFTDNFFAKKEEDTKYLHSSILFNDLLDVPIIDVSATPALPVIFTEIERELSGDKDVFQYDILQNLLHNLLLIAERERRRQGFKEITKGADLDCSILFRDLLNAKFKTLKSVSGYAALMNVSEKRLTNATVKTLGTTPKTMIDERVMLEAKRLLVHTNLSIKEVGYDLGFKEPTNFIKYFRKHIEKTPIEFREEYFEK